MPEDMTDAPEVDESPVQTANHQAENMHQTLDQIKRMAIQAAVELETMAEFAESSDEIEQSAEELEEASKNIMQVHNRISRGDRTMVKD